MAKNKRNLPHNIPAHQNNNMHVVKAEAFAGPLPHPEILRQYDQIVENGAERIIKMAENQSAHRQALEKWAIKGGTILSFAGAFAATIISLGLFYFSYLLITGGFAVSGTVLSGVNLVALVYTFIYGTRSRKDERADKDRKSRI